MKKQNKTRFFLGLSQALMSLHFLFLGGDTAAAIQAFLAGRSWISNFIRSKFARHVLFWISLGCILSFTYLTWSGYKSIIPAVAALNSTYAMCYLSNKNMRKMLLLSSFIWLTNGIVWESTPQILSEIIKVIVNVYTILTMTKRNEFTTEKKNPQSTTPTDMTKEDWELEREITRRFDSD